VQAILDGQVSAAELRGMLRLRRAEIQAQIENETAKLTRVEARLLTIEEEGRVPADGVVIKHLSPMRVGELTGTAESYEPDAITPVIRPLYSDLFCRVCSAGVTTAGPAVAYYEDAPDGDGTVVVHAAVPVVAGTPGDQGFSVVDLAEVQKAAAIIHQGSMNDVLSTGQALARWIDANGYRSVGYAREVTIEWSPDSDEWVTELQQPIDATQLEDEQMSATPEIETRAEQPYVAISSRVPMSGLAGVGARLGEVFAWLGARGVAPAGPPFFKYNVIDMAGDLEVEGVCRSRRPWKEMRGCGPVCSRPDGTRP
jgi:effector-binding domain-containing protein